MMMIDANTIAEILRSSLLSLHGIFDLNATELYCRILRQCGAQFTSLYGALAQY